VESNNPARLEVREQTRAIACPPCARSLVWFFSNLVRVPGDFSPRTSTGTLIPDEANAALLTRRRWPSADAAVVYAVGVVSLVPYNRLGGFGLLTQKFDRIRRGGLHAIGELVGIQARLTTVVCG